MPTGPTLTGSKLNSISQSSEAIMLPVSSPVISLRVCHQVYGPTFEIFSTYQSSVDNSRFACSPTQKELCWVVFVREPLLGVGSVSELRIGLIVDRWMGMFGHEPAG